MSVDQKISNSESRGIMVTLLCGLKTDMCRECICREVKTVYDLNDESSAVEWRDEMLSAFDFR